MRGTGCVTEVVGRALYADELNADELNADELYGYSGLQEGTEVAQCAGGAG